VKGRKELSWHGLHLIFELNAKRQRGKCTFTVIEGIYLESTGLTTVAVVGRRQVNEERQIAAKS
jgi:hypothetical protein